MILYLGKRLAVALVTVLLVVSATFVLSFVLPGDPARMLAGPQASEADVSAVRAEHGLDRPLLVQFGRYWANLLHARGREGEHTSCGDTGVGLHVDLGFSLQYRKPVLDVLADKAPRSAALAAFGLAFGLAFGSAAGLFAASRAGRRSDALTIGATLLGISVPTFVIGLILQYVLAYKLRWLPLDGGSAEGSLFPEILLPALTLGIYSASLYARLVREQVLAELPRPHIRTARAKGASRPRVLFIHALRAALVPVVTVAALDLGALISGAVITEELFRWPGLGQMAVYAIKNRDTPLIVGTVLFTSTVVVLLMLLLDLVVGLIDPRLRRRTLAET